VPELPEVETVRAGLARFVLDREVAAVSVDHPRAVRRHVPGAGDFTSRLIGRRILSAQRRGKYLWLPLDSGEAVLAHLGMSGQLLVQPRPRRRRSTCGFGCSSPIPDPSCGSSTSAPSAAVREPMVEVDGDVVPVSIAHIARDPLDPRFEPARFVTALRRNTPNSSGHCLIRA